MNHMVFGYTDSAARSAPVMLYGGPDRAAARAAFDTGAPGIVRTDYHYNPMAQQTHRFPTPDASASVPASPPSTTKEGGQSGTGQTDDAQPDTGSQVPESPPKLPLPGKPLAK